MLLVRSRTFPGPTITSTPHYLLLHTLTTHCAWLLPLLLLLLLQPLPNTGPWLCAVTGAQPRFFWPLRCLKFAHFWDVLSVCCLKL
jgi:hypothetical protein